MTTLLKKPVSLFKAFLDIVLPPVCYVCGKPCSGKYGLCEMCLEKIRRITPPACAKCGRKLHSDVSICGDCSVKNSYIEKGWCACYYEGSIKECIHLFKYNGYLGLVDIFRDITLDSVKRNVEVKDADIIVPVPIYSTKKRERAYNHAEVIARAISKNISIPVDSRNLKKIRWTKSQSELDRQKRLENVKGSFIVVDKNAFLDKNVILVDDVYTTGATINECAKTLKNAGVNKVYFLALARGA